MPPTHPPAAPLTRGELELLVGDAVLGPSIHNTQPWRFRGTGDSIELHVDAERGLAVTDPLGRALVVSCGAALLNLRLSCAVRLGREPVVRRVPAGDRTGHLATVRAAGPRPPNPEEVGLHAALGRRRTSRRPFADRRLPDRLVTELAEGAAREGASLLPLSGAAVRVALAVTAEAEQLWAEDPAYREELARWTAAAAGRQEGVPADALGPRDRIGRVPQRDFGLASTQPPTTAAFEEEPQLAVLSTPADRVEDRVRAGEALQRVLLMASMSGVSVGLLHQAVERRELRWLLRDPLHGTGHAQMLLRLGYDDAPPPPATPRRTVADVLDRPLD